MWFNGFITVIDMALTALDRPFLHRHRDGADPRRFSGRRLLRAGHSSLFSRALAHALPPPRAAGRIRSFRLARASRRADKFLERAVREFAAGREASAFVQLGRAAHPLIDMACPVHAQGVAHAADPFEVVRRGARR